MTRIYVVYLFDGNEHQAVVACLDEETADAIASMLGSDGSVESLPLVRGADAGAE
jgi:hypothetical protein